MSKVERPGRFRGDLWFQERVAERTRAALKEAHERFEAEHKNDSDEMLIEYVREQKQYAAAAKQDGGTSDQ